MCGVSVCCVWCGCVLCCVCGVLGVCCVCVCVCVLEWCSSVDWEGATPHFIAHTMRDAHAQVLSIFFIFVVFLFPFSCVDLDVVFSDMGSVLTELLRAKCGAATRKCVEADGGFAQAAN